MDTLQYIEERNRIKGFRKGRKEGLQKGKQEVILNMLKEKMNITLISKLAGVPVKEIKKLKNSS